jgi:hypothetical protein
MGRPMTGVPLGIEDNYTHEFFGGYKYMHSIYFTHCF